MESSLLADVFCWLVVDGAGFWHFLCEWKLFPAICRAEPKSSNPILEHVTARRHPVICDFHRRSFLVGVSIHLGVCRSGWVDRPGFSNVWQQRFGGLYSARFGGDEPAKNHAQGFAKVARIGSASDLFASELALYSRPGTAKDLYQIIVFRMITLKTK